MTPCAHPPDRLLVSRAEGEVTRVFCQDCSQVLFRRWPVVAVDPAEPQMQPGEHFATCSECGQLFDRRELGSVLRHLVPGHRPEPRH